MIRSIFYYNTCPQLGATVGLHFFEPRYRVLVQRAMHEPQRARSFVFLPNYSDYQAAHGDLGYLATITAFQPQPGRPGELPRADVQLRFDQRVILLFHWVESNTGGLCECICMPVDRSMPVPSHLPAAAAEEIASWTRLDWLSGVDGPHLLRAHNHGFNDAAGHCLLHARSEAEAEASLTLTLTSHRSPSPSRSRSPSSSPSPSPSPTPSPLRRASLDCAWSILRWLIERIRSYSRRRVNSRLPPRS